MEGYVFFLFTSTRVPTKYDGSKYINVTNVEIEGDRLCNNGFGRNLSAVNIGSKDTKISSALLIKMEMNPLFLLDGKRERSQTFVTQWMVNNETE